MSPQRPVRPCRIYMMFAVAILFARQPTVAETLLDEAHGAKRIVSGCAFTEGPIVDEFGNLYFSDAPNDRIMKWSAAGQLSTFLQPCGAANGLLFDLEGQILLCQSARSGGARAIARRNRDGTVTTLTDEFEGNRYIAPNDLCIDAKGRIYFTDPFYDGDKSQPHSGVYRLDPDGAVELLRHDLDKPNGILITPDDRWIYVSDRGTQKLRRYQLTDEGRLIGDKVIYDFAPDRGIDGMWIDIRGNIYGAAGQGGTTGLFIISPDGRLLRHHTLPELATNVTFGGADMRDLYVTAGTSVYKLRTTIPGVKHRYLRKGRFGMAAELKEVLRRQAQAWNDGDIPKFMEYYWKSDQLTFSSGGKTTRGWAATLASYQRRYATREKMGRLRFDHLEIIPLGAVAALVLGRWHLQRADDAPHGNFSLVFRRIDNQWRIVHDHTSLAADDAAQQ